MDELDDVKSKKRNLKRGSLSEDEILLILEQSAYKTDAELAVLLNRSESQIAIGKKRAQLKSEENDKKEKDKEILQKYSLVTKPFWRELKQHFSQDELRLAQEIWFALYKQFGEDVTPTEELQIIDLIQLQVLINRNLAERHQAQRILQILDNKIIEENGKPSDEQNPELIMRLTDELNMGSSAQNQRTIEYKNLLEKKTQLMKDVKGTRDQRYKEIKDSKETFFTWLKTHNERQLRQEESHVMELHKIAMEKEKQRLGGYHTYLDNTIDRPLLNAETVEYDSEINIQESEDINE